MPRAIITGSLAPPMRRSTFNSSPLSGTRPGIPVYTSTGGNYPGGFGDQPLVGTSGGFNPNTGGQPSDPWGPVIDQGCSNLPTYLQGVCRAAGNALTNTGSPGGGTQVVPGTDPTPGTTTPAERSMGATGLSAPMLVNRSRLECLPAPNGGRQVLYYAPMTGEQVCLPAKGGAAFARSMGLIRKWTPRPKPYISAQDVKVLKKADRMTKKAKAFAKLTGQTCHARGRGRR